MEGNESPQNINRAHLLHRYKEKRTKIEQSLKRRQENLPQKNFDSIVSRATAEAFRSEKNSPIDDLTGLIKKKEFLNTLRVEMERAFRAGSTLSVLVVDLDGFKNLNDTHGHDAGDDALKLIAAQLQGSVRSYDTVARIGGDEFGILEHNDTPDTSEKIAQRIDQSILDNKRKIKGFELLSASIGIAEYIPSMERVTAEELLKRADIAMYNAKMVQGTHVVKWQAGMTISPGVTSRR